ncbi:SpoIIE family protein phosphatase [Modestobacter sp. I12A-02628]|uniref:SpoIIE family protein phosphatase n=1 Tax=Goekera deserti TaxID=2497753 RepID=A0A7K3WDJ2_9ACTN|nr:SpoIIE family protein phosphatase [Goekera deserti]MPQ98265.1 SpoIIE family protein phosphatase [Goekera deserti]NDI48091.1 SpoIIE family protein phosphatase [Goekera deserti]NEL53840.1 SpoIIE family protein phosphatase [Goekera deserti]
MSDRTPPPAADFLAPGAPVDLSNCEREPIHVPGSIQPRGVLLAVTEPDQVVVQVSENLADVFGVPWQQALGRPLTEVLGVVPAGAIARSASAFGDLRERNPVELIIDRDGTPLPVDALLHRVVFGGGATASSAWGSVRSDAPAGDARVSTLVVELEPASGPRPFSFPNTYQAIRGTVAQLDRAATVQELYDITAQAVRALTGFDRVMVYRYDADHNGEVVAEAKAGHLDSFLGLHYPASDIPAQARALYEKNWIRLISDVGYTPARIHPVDHPGTGRPLDLTWSALRSVSPIHVEYLSNMGVQASMSISLLRDGKLWGLIACHHHSGPHAPPYATRAAAEFLGSTLSVRLVDRVSDDEMRRALRARSTLAWLTAATLDEDRTLTDALLGEPDLLQLVPADSVVVSLRGDLGSAGASLSERLIARLARWAATRGEDVVATDCLRDSAPELGAPAGDASGALVVPLPGDQFVLWVRGETVRTVDWGGDPHNKAIAESDGDQVRISPRKSFERWRETVRGRSEPWTPAELADVAQLRTHLLEALYARSRRVQQAAETLQRSMLSEPPRLPDLEIAVRYTPAALESHIGGDWYDVFPQPDGATVFVIGDVVGHDTEAAACMSQLRGLLRGIAYATDDGPAAVLGTLDRAIAGLELDAMATVVVARLEQTPDERARGAARLRWASAGHLPPAVVSADGSERVLRTPRPALLLGVDPAARREDREVPLTAGDTFVLYTDGLVERRRESLDAGVGRLTAALTELHDRPVQQLADRLLDRLVPGRCEDDVALVAVRFTPGG